MENSTGTPSPSSSRFNGAGNDACLFPTYRTENLASDLSFVQKKKKKRRGKERERRTFSTIVNKTKGKGKGATVWGDKGNRKRDSRFIRDRAQTHLDAHGRGEILSSGLVCCSTSTGSNRSGHGQRWRSVVKSFYRWVGLRWHPEARAALFIPATTENGNRHVSTARPAVEEIIVKDAERGRRERDFNGVKGNERRSVESNIGPRDKTRKGISSPSSFSSSSSSLLRRFLIFFLIPRADAR